MEVLLLEKPKNYFLRSLFIFDGIRQTNREDFCFRAFFISFSSND